MRAPFRPAGYWHALHSTRPGLTRARLGTFSLRALSTATPTLAPLLRVSQTAPLASKCPSRQLPSSWLEAPPSSFAAVGMHDAIVRVSPFYDMKVDSAYGPGAWVVSLGRDSSEFAVP